MSINIFRLRNLTILAVLALAGVLAVWLLQQGAINNESEVRQDFTKESKNRGSRLPLKSLINIPIRGQRVNSIAEGENKAGFSLKAPQSLFGKTPQIFLSEMTAPNGQFSVTFVFSDKANPTNSEGSLNIGWRDPHLASPAEIVAQAKKDGNPFYSLREHKGLPGYTLEKGTNPLGPEGREPRPALVVWPNGENEYSLKGPIGMGLDELIPIADSVD